MRGKYKIIEQIGAGGMAIVFKARHVRFDELRALKVMKPELAADQSFVTRFMHEAVVTRKLQHPNAVGWSLNSLSQNWGPHHFVPSDCQKQSKTLGVY